MTDSITIEPGYLVAVPGHWGERLLRIDQTRYDGFQLVFDENDPAMIVELDTRGANRHPEEGPPVGDPPRPAPIPNLDRLELKGGDLFTVPGFGTKQIGSIQKIREGRYQLRLIQKYQHDVVIDVVASAPTAD